jgi:hypothetical protein
VEHTSGFRPPGQDFTHAARQAKRARGKQDHASRRYQRHMDERFRARGVERTQEEAEESEEE